MSTASSMASLIPAGAGSRRALLIGAVAVAALGVWAVSRWASEPTYVALYRGMELKDAGAVVEGLKKGGIRYKLDGGGTDVLVPVADAARARVALAQDGLPSSGRPGLELFDKPSWGMTDFAQRVTFQRALEGELARTIGTLRGIERAEVHLVMPAPSPLRRNDRVAGASVVVTLRPGTELPPETVQGITYIVSNSVEQMAPDNVAIMDDAGRVLSVPAAGSGGSGLTTRQLEIQRSVEQHLASKIESLLGTVLGVGRSRAQVSALLSFDQVDRTIDSFDPDGAVIQTEQRSENEGGESGAQTIVSNAYQNSRRIEKIVGAVGNVTRLSVSVLVDRAVLEGEKASAVDIPRLQAMVANAIGVDSTRGDRLSVVAAPFEPVAVAAEAGAGAAKPGPDLVMVAERVSRPVVGIVAIAVLVLLALRVLKGGVGGATAAAPAGPEANGTANGGGDAAEIAMLRQRLLSAAPDKPELTAQVLRAWLTESK